MDEMLTILPALRESHARIAALRRDLHAHPETAFVEERTAGVVARFLEAAGVTTHRGIAKTGVVGALKVGSGTAAIGLRADMDALHLTEKNTFGHCSQHAGVMHACGHDGHTAMLLAAAEYLAATRRFDGTVYFIFQPAEEGLGGGRQMVEEGLFTRFPMQQVFGLHNWPGIPVGQMAVMPGPVMASSDEVEITVRGQGAHAAMPHQGADPVLAGAAMVQALQSIVSRNVPPVESAVVSITQFHAGDAYNVIPDTAVLRGTVRAFSPELQDQMEAAIGRVCQGVAAAHGVSVEVRYRRGYPPTVNDAHATELCRVAARSVLGDANVLTDVAPTMGAEDFAFMLREKPGCYVWLGNGPGAGGCMLHNPHYDFNDDIIPLGASYWVRLVEQLLAAGPPVRG